MVVRHFTRALRLVLVTVLAVVGSLVWSAPAQAAELRLLAGQTDTGHGYVGIMGCTTEYDQDGYSWVLDISTAAGRHLLTETSPSSVTEFRVTRERLGGYGVYRVTLTCLGYDGQPIGTVTEHFSLEDHTQAEEISACPGDSVTLTRTGMPAGLVLRGSLYSLVEGRELQVWPAITTVGADGVATMTVTIPEDVPLETLGLSATSWELVDGVPFAVWGMRRYVAIQLPSRCGGPSIDPTVAAPSPSVPGSRPLTLPATGG